jgi:hypothetical protein
MALTQLMNAASDRMEAAAVKLRRVRQGPFTPSGLQEWLNALTDYALALGEVQAFSQESIHEKLQLLARDLHRSDLGSPRRKAG